jgi:hypothetical protein
VASGFPVKFGKMWKTPELEVRKAFLLDESDSLMQGRYEFPEVLLVQENLVLFVRVFSRPLAFRDGQEEILSGTGGLHVEEIGPFSGRDAPGKDFVPIAAAAMIIPAIIVIRIILAHGFLCARSPFADRVAVNMHKPW